MKVIQVNIWMGHLLHPLLKLIDEQKPDVLCAQEVLSAQSGHGLYDFYQAHQRLAERFPHHFFAPTYSFNALGEICNYGNAIYSKYPLSERKVVFTVGEFIEEITIESLKRHGEIRNVQYCKVATEGQASFTIANHHGYHNRDFDGAPESVASMRNAAAALEEVSGPLILCGDFNANPTSETVRQLDGLGLRNLSAEHAIRNTLSKVHRFDFEFVSDYILVSPEISPVKFSELDVIVSDHKPLIADFDAQALES